MLHFACSTDYFTFTLTLSLSRNDAVGKGERDRPGRSVRRLAEQLVRQIPLTVWCARATAAGSSAGRRRERSRRPRSPSSTASFRLREREQRAPPSGSRKVWMVLRGENGSPSSQYLFSAGLRL